MTTYLLTWNPKDFVMEAGDYFDQVLGTSGRHTTKGWWSTGVRTKDIGPGDRVLLVRQRNHRGIVASGTCLTDVKRRADRRDRRKKANYVRIEWDSWRRLDERLPIETLHARVPGVEWDRLQGSGVKVDDHDAAIIERLWAGPVRRAMSR